MNERELYLLTNKMIKTPAKCIFRKGDKVILNEIGKIWIKFSKIELMRRKVGVVVGYSRRFPWCVNVKWIEGEDDIPPLKNAEGIAWPFLDFYFEEGEIND